MKTDGQLQREIIDELTWDPRINPSQIGVMVNEGQVTLTGWVSHHLEKGYAERIAKRIDGVRSLSNQIEVMVITPEMLAEHSAIRKHA